jgi:hypothetical protein
VIARHRVDLLAPVLAQRAELPHNLETLLVIRQIPQPGIVAEVQGDIPMERRTAELAAALRLPERRGQTLGVTGRRRERHAIADRVGNGFVGRHMGVREDPQMEGLRLTIAAGCRLHVRHVLPPLPMFGCPSGGAGRPIDRGSSPDAGANGTNGISVGDCLLASLHWKSLLVSTRLLIILWA